MSQLGPVGISLSVVFALFMTLLFFELCYVWWSRQRRLRETGEARSSNVQSAAMAMKRAHWKCTTWSKIVCAGCSLHETEEPKRWVKLLCWLSPADAKMACSDAVEEGGKVGAGQQQQGEEEVEEDVLGLGGLWAPARLLFTIKEETKEEMELEEVRCKGSVSRRASSEQLLFVASSCTSPFVTPPSSPPFATPFGSPATPALPPNNTLVAVEVDSSSSSTSSSSPLLGRRPLSVLFGDSSSFSPSSVASSAATPATLSPSDPPPCISCSSSSPNKRGQRGHPLCLLLDPPPSPSSALYHYHNRVHPVTLSRCNISGKPKSSPTSFPFTKPEPPLPFHIPAPSQPTTPCPFRPSLHAKSVASYNINASTFIG